MHVTPPPQPLWRFFEEISSIPRASKHEGAVLAYVKRFADDRGLPWREDSAGNMVVEREGSNGGEGAPTVVIQGESRKERGNKTPRHSCVSLAKATAPSCLRGVAAAKFPPQRGSRDVERRRKYCRVATTTAHGKGDNER